jgi:hypothetical protein
MFTEMRCPVGFESLYQGIDADYPIVITPYADGLDPAASAQFSKLKSKFQEQAGAYPIVSDGSGISPFLIGGLPVPLLSTVMIYLPPLYLSTDNPRYKFQVVWRIRSLVTSEAPGGVAQPFHGRNNEPGPTDTGENNFFSSPPGGPAWSGTSTRRFPIVACEDSITYPAVEPTGGAVAEENVYWVDRVPATNPDYKSPLLAGFTAGQAAYGQIAQGLTQNPTFVAPSHVPYPTMAKGDELVMMIWRESTDTAPNWDFAGVDAAVSQVLGRGVLIDGVYVPINAGVFVSTGVSS